MGESAITIILPSDSAAALLFWTNDSILASNYHRNSQGFINLYNLLHKADMNRITKILQQRHAKAWLWCKDSPPAWQVEGETLKNTKDIKLPDAYAQQMKIIRLR